MKLYWEYDGEEIKEGDERGVINELLK